MGAPVAPAEPAFGLSVVDLGNEVPWIGAWPIVGMGHRERHHLVAGRLQESR